MCSNDSKISRDEVNQIDVLMQNAPKTLKDKVVRNAKTDDGNRFKMERV